jgi:hypothetical protein
MTISPILILLSCPSIQTEPIQVSGLKEGESFTELAPGHEPIEERSSFSNYGIVRYIPGRVVNAFTREPIVDAMIETWSEELNPHVGSFQRIGEALSGTDGRFRVENGEKARILAAGYLVWSGPGGDLWGPTVELFPVEEAVPKIRVIDTNGLPIYNAVVTSTYSCSHDVPAFEARSNSAGIVRLPGFGMQDHVQDLRIRAGGYAGTEYLWGKPALAMDEPLTVVMPRQERRLEMQLLDTEGMPIKFEAVHVIDGECYHVGFTSDYGHLQFPYRYLAQDVTIRPVTNIRGYNSIGNVDLIPEEMVAFRLDGDRWPEEEAAILQIVPPADGLVDTHNAEGELFHEYGWRGGFSARNFGKDKDPITFPEGEAFLHIGGGFLPYAEEWIELDLTAGESTEVRPQWKPQPSFSLQYPDEIKLLWREAGGFSDEFQGWEDEYYYPAGSKLVICGKHGDQTKFWELDQPQGEVDLLQCKELDLLPPLPNEQNALVHEVEIKIDFAGEADGWWELRNAFGELDPPKLKDGAINTYILKAPELGPVIGKWNSSDQGYCRFKIIPGQTSSLNLKPFRSANLEIECDQSYELASLGGTGNLHPGPNEFVIQLEDGRRIGVRLNLEPGEEREITVLSKE